MVDKARCFRQTNFSFLLHFLSLTEPLRRDRSAVKGSCSLMFPMFTDSFALCNLQKTSENSALDLENRNRKRKRNQNWTWTWFTVCNHTRMNLSAAAIRPDLQNVPASLTGATLFFVWIVNLKKINSQEHFSDYHTSLVSLNAPPTTFSDWLC